MSTAKKILWIDDTPGRKQTAEDLGAVFIDVRNQDVADKIRDVLKGPQPQLVILDHILDKTATTNPVFFRGSTIAEAIKEHWPACPVVGVTAAANIQDIDARTRQTYDVLFSSLDLSKYLPRIEAMPHDFAAIAKASRRKARDLVKLLKPPENEIERLENALPDDLKKFFGEAIVSSLLYRWVNKLLERPGFLYPDLWAATILGLNETGFQKVLGSFRNAKYAGVFAREDEPRWWSSRLSDILYKQCQPEPGELSWHVGRRLSGIKDVHFSSCHYCKEEYPETVAFLDEASSEQRAMHLRCTVLHPRYNRELYFEDIRMMRGK